MIKEEVIITVKTDTSDVKQNIDNTNKSTSSLSEKLKQLNKEVDSGELSFRQLNKKIQEYQTIGLAAGQNSIIGKEAIKNAADLKDKLVDLNSRVTNLSQDGQKLQGALQLGSTVVAGYTAFQGVTALLGVENENLQKTLVKLQAAQSLLMATEQIRASLEKDSQLTIQASILLDKLKAASTSALATVTGTATGAMKALKIAIAATGIGALIVGVGLLIANFKEIGAWVTKTINRFEFLQKAIEPLIATYEAVILVMQKLGLADSEETKLAKKNAEERLVTIAKEREEKVSAIDFEIAKRKAAGKDTIALEKEKTEIIKQSIIAEAQGILALVKLRGEYNQEQKDRLAELKNDLVKITQESAIKEIEETKKAEDKKIEVQKVANENAKKEREKEHNDKIKKLQDEQALADELFISNQQRTMSETDFAIQEIIRGNEAKFAIAEGNFELTQELEKEQQAQIDEVKQAQADKEYEAKVENDLRIKEANDALMEANYQQGLKELEAEKAIATAKRETIANNLNMTANVLSNFSDIAGKETAEGKSLAVAAATINTYRGVSDALAATTVTPFETALKFANAISIGIAGMMNVRKIISVPVPKSAPIAAPSFSAPTNTASSSGTQTPTPTLTTLGTTEETNLKQEPSKIYIVDSEIQASNKRNSESVSFATIY